MGQVGGWVDGGAELRNFGLEIVDHLYIYQVDGRVLALNRESHG